MPHHPRTCPPRTPRTPCRPRRPSPSLSLHLPPSPSTSLPAPQAHHRRLLVWLRGARALGGSAAPPAGALSLGRARAARHPVCAGGGLPYPAHARAVAGGKRGPRPRPWPGHARWPRLCVARPLRPGRPRRVRLRAARLWAQLARTAACAARWLHGVHPAGAFGTQEPCLMHAWRSDWNVSQLPCFDAARFAPAVLRHLTDPLHETSQCFR